MPSPDSRGSRFEELPHRVDQRVLGERFQKKGVSARFSRPVGRRQDAEDQHGDIARSEVRLELAGHVVAGLRLREIGLGEEQVVKLVSSQTMVVCQVCNARLAIGAALAEMILVELVPLARAA